VALWVTIHRRQARRTSPINNAPKFIRHAAELPDHLGIAELALGRITRPAKRPDIRQQKGRSNLASA
jgi:hypothetical protein